MKIETSQRNFDTELIASMDEAIWIWTAGGSSEAWDESEAYLYKTVEACIVLQLGRGAETGAKRLEALVLKNDLPGDSVEGWTNWVYEKLRVACAFGAEAIIANYRGHDTAAWCAIIDMRTQISEAKQFWSLKSSEIGTAHRYGESRRLTAIRASLASHAENHDARDLVRSHFVANRSSFRSKDEAAERIAGKLVPHTYRTVRKWLSGV